MRLLAFLTIVLLSASHFAVAQTSTPLINAESLPINNSLAHEPVTEVIDTSLEVEDHGNGHSEAGLPQFNTSTFASQLFWLAITFLVLYVYFAKKALPALSTTIDNRRMTIKNDLMTADRLSIDADNVKEDYEHAIAKAQADARETSQAIEVAMRQKSELETKSFNEKSMEKIAAVEKRAEQAKDAIKGELEAVATELTADIISKLADMNVNTSDIQKVINDQLSQKTSSTQNKKAA